MPIIPSNNPEPVVKLFDNYNIYLTSSRIIFNYIIDAFGKRAILPEEVVHNLGTGYMEEEYGNNNNMRGIRTRKAV